ncbi:LLM class flavin-dependent oxidoreductase [Ktedonospora formicarum]|nr:LLM class flavin-dependent oxidoreductase [Ktedonospora formicarum]
MQTNNESSVSTRERVGLALAGSDTVSAVDAIGKAESAGVRQIWMTQSTPLPDTLGIFTAAAMKTSSIRMGTAIVPTYPRHPLALAQQALTIADLAPDRLRLGVGPSHRPVMEGVYGLSMESPHEHLREYVAVLRALLWDGKVDFQGKYYTVKSTFPRPPRIPILVSALRENAFHLAGEISDGSLSWVCPPPYLLEKSLPAQRAGAAEVGRSVPPLVAHIPVAFSQDKQAVLAATRQQLGRYGKLPFYVKMFASAGFTIPSSGELPEDLVESLVLSGDDATIAERVRGYLDAGLDEVMLFPITIKDVSAEQVQLMRFIGQL